MVSYGPTVHTCTVCTLNNFYSSHNHIHLTSPTPTYPLQAVSGCSILYLAPSGKGNLSNIAMYKQWNNLTHISGWLGDGGVIRGGEGVLFSPQISRDQQLYAYISQLYRCDLEQVYA